MAPSFNHYEMYVNKLCDTCTKEGECNIALFSVNGTTYVKCSGYKKDNSLDLCMKTHCIECRNYNKCFGGDNNA